VLLRKATRLSATLIAEYQALLAQVLDEPDRQTRLDDLLGAQPLAKGGPRR
jgi:glucose-6-phosphate dehydrogenase assembly protein OpcA